jgi:hypothetical protein
MGFPPDVNVPIFYENMGELLTILIKTYDGRKKIMREAPGGLERGTPLP